MAQHTAYTAALSPRVFARVMLPAMIAGAVLLPALGAAAMAAQSGIHGHGSAVAGGANVATSRPFATADPAEWNSSGS